eukprot:6176958-Pleurochrysis_carterae.AAC.1
MRAPASECTAYARMQGLRTRESYARAQRLERVVGEHGLPRGLASCTCTCSFDDSSSSSDTQTHARIRTART